MFGIGASELLIIGVVLLIAVGPSKLPKLLKAGMGTYREFRRATRELRASSGIDELLQDEDLKDLKDLRNPLRIKELEDLGKPVGTVAAKKGGGRKPALTFGELAQEDPPEGVDIAEIRDEEDRPSEEEQARIRAEKEEAHQREVAIKEAKIAAAAGQQDEVTPEQQAIIDAKNAAAAEDPFAARSAPEEAADPFEESSSEATASEA